MTLNELRAALKAGATPRKMGFKVIGSGAFRRAYSDGKWVVKRNYLHGSSLHKAPEQGKRQWIHGCNTVPIAPYWLVGRYIIQRRYKTLDYNQQRKFRTQHYTCNNDYNHDIHSYNVGLTKRGEFVAFDW